MADGSELEQPERPQVVSASSSQRPVSPTWQKECRRFGGWLSGASFVAALAWLTGANAVVPLSDGKVIHASYVGWPLALMVIGVVVGIYIYLAASNERLPIPGRARVGIDHSYRYSLVFKGVSIRFQFNDDDADALGASIGVEFSNSYGKPIQMYLEHLDVTINGVVAGPYAGAVRKIRIMPNEVRSFRSPIVQNISQGYFNGNVKYSVLYGPLDASTIYRHTHQFECTVTGVRVTVYDLKKSGPGGSEWTDLEPETDSDMPEGYNYPRTLAHPDLINSTH